MLGHRRPFPARLGVYVAGALTPALIACSGPPPVPTPNPTVEALAAENERLRAGASVAAPQAPVATPTPQPTPTVISLEDAIALVTRYTVLVRTDRGGGSGVSLGGGTVLTNYHVVEDGGQVVVRFASGRQEPVQIAGVDPRRDLALLRSSFTDEPAAPIGEAGALRPGEPLVAVGYPLTGIIGTQVPTVTRGAFSGRRQSDGVWLVQTDTSLNPGNSGGPLADSQGRLIGVATFGIRAGNARGLEFAVAADEVKAFLAAPMQAPVARASPPAAVTPSPTATSTPPPKPVAPPPAFTPTPSPPTPTTGPAKPAPIQPALLGLQVRAPAEGARVPERVIVQGVQARATPGGSHVWLFVIARVEGSRWYPCPREIVARPDGTWSCELYLGGPSGVRHEIRVGVVDDAVHAFLSRHVATSPNQPLYPDAPPGSLPRAFVEEARVSVVRQ